MDTKEYEMVYQKNFVDCKELELGACCSGDDCMQQSEQYKQVFSRAECRLQRKEQDAHFQVLAFFNDYITRSKNEDIAITWGGLASVFLLLTWYSLRILRAPWRKSYHRIKAFGGHFQHHVYSSFPESVVDELMGRMGFIYHRPQQTFFFNPESISSGGNWREGLTRVGMDFFLVHVHCSLTLRRNGRSMPVHVDPLRSNDSLRDYANLSRDQALAQLSKRQNQTGATKSALIKSAPLPSTAPQSNTLPAKSSRSVRSLEGAWDRVEVVPNQYASGATMRKHNQPRSAGPAIPWGHRLNPSTKPSAALWPPGHPSRRGNDYLDNRELTQPSIVDGTIRYPPRDMSYLPPSEGVDDVPARGSKSDRASTRHRHPDDNYVIARPLQSGRAATKLGLEGRIESGYFSRKSLQRPYENVKGEGDGEYVHVFPPKRPPADGRPEPPVHIYQEITAEDFDDITPRTSSPGSHARFWQP